MGVVFVSAVEMALFLLRAFSPRKKIQILNIDTGKQKTMIFVQLKLLSKKSVKYVMMFYILDCIKS